MITEQVLEEARRRKALGHTFVQLKVTKPLRYKPSGAKMRIRGIGMCRIIGQVGDSLWWLVDAPIKAVLAADDEEEV